MTPQPAKRVLFVDDDENLLNGLRRAMRRRMEIETAASAVEGLRMLDKSGPFAVIVVDANMPKIDGATFLQKVRQSFPDVVRIMMTGNSDQATAVRAVNDGHVFCFLTKPCQIETLVEKIDEAYERHMGIVTERQILEETVQGSVKLLSDMLAMAYPKAFKQARIVQRWALACTEALGIEDNWAFRVASMLWPLSDTMLPDDLALKRDRDEPLSAEEIRQLMETHQAAVHMLEAIPRLSEVSRMIMMSDSTVRVMVEGLRPGRETRLLQILIDLSRIVATFKIRDIQEAFDILKQRNKSYDPALLAAVPAILNQSRQAESAEAAILSLTPIELRVDDMLLDDVIDVNGKLLLASGQLMSQTTIAALGRLFANGAVRSAIRVVRSVKLEAA